MEIGMYQAIATVVLVVSGSSAYIATSEDQRPRWQGLMMFMGRRGNRFLTLLMIGSLLVFLAAAIYLVFTAWILCVVGVPITIILLGPLLSPIVLRFVVYPTYKIYELFCPDSDDHR